MFDFRHNRRPPEKINGRERHHPLLALIGGTRLTWRIGEAQTAKAEGAKVSGDLQAKEALTRLPVAALL